MNLRHVVLTTYGEPPNAAFGPQLRYSWRLLLELTRTIAPIPRPLLPLIALFRAIRRTASWSFERYGSPLECLSRAQAEALAQCLSQRDAGRAWRVHTAYEFRDPRLCDILAAVEHRAPVDIVPMYVADSAFTHALSRHAAASPSGRAGCAVEVQPALDEGRFAELSSAHILDELHERCIPADQSWGLLLTAHGTPLVPPKDMETGREATERIGRAIATHLKDSFGAIQIGWLNHARGGRWTEPPAAAALAQMIEAGTRRLVYYPFGFLADNAETQLEGRQVLRPALRSGLDEAVHLPCLNAKKSLMEALADQILA